MKQQEEIVFSDFYLTREASAIASFTAAVSSLSSALIVYITLRSGSDKQGSSYHQIMFFVSACDLMASLAIACTTLPMPPDSVYAFEGARYGNASTCSLQAFFAYVGNLAGIYSICILCIYYVCVIRYKIREKAIRRCIRLFFVPPLGFFATVGGMFWAKGLFNPQPYEPFCTVGSYPLGCRTLPLPVDRVDATVDATAGTAGCIRGGEVGAFVALMVRFNVPCSITIGMLTVTTSMVLIVTSVRANSRVLVAKAASTASARFDDDVEDVHVDVDVDVDALSSLNDGNSNPHTIHHNDTTSVTDNNNSNPSCPSSINIFSQRARHHPSNEVLVVSSPERNGQHLEALRLAKTSLKRTKDVTNQALMYLTAFLLTWLFTLLSMIPIMRQAQSLVILKMMFHPLQGFFNALIFVHHKVHNVMEVNPTKSFPEALKEVISRPSRVPEVMISSIEVVGLEQIHRRLDVMKASNEEENEFDEQDAPVISSVEQEEGRGSLSGIGIDVEDTFTTMGGAAAAAAGENKSNNNLDSTNISSAYWKSGLRRHGASLNPTPYGHNVSVSEDSAGAGATGPADADDVNRSSSYQYFLSEASPTAIFPPSLEDLVSEIEMPCARGGDDTPADVYVDDGCDSQYRSIEPPS